MKTVFQKEGNMGEKNYEIFAEDLSTQEKEFREMESKLVELAGHDVATIEKNGMFDPGLTVEVDKSIMYDFVNKGNGELLFRPFPEYTDGMNMQFNGGAEVLFGNFKVENNKSIFSITDPREAEQVMVRVGIDEYGFEPGQTPDSPEAQSAKFFSTVNQPKWYAPHDLNRLNLEDDPPIGVYEHGINFYVLNVGHVLGEPDRDVSKFLEEMADQIAQEKTEYEKMLEEHGQEVESHQGFNFEKYIKIEHSNDLSIDELKTAADLIEEYKEYVDKYDFEPKIDIDDVEDKITDQAYNKFKGIESEIRNFDTSESIRENAETLASLAEQYMDLSEQYGFETRFEFDFVQLHELEQNNKRFDDTPGYDR